ncbi:MAG: SUF system Fe-S cluster assembly regulator [Myxococcota bacterium]
MFRLSKLTDYAIVLLSHFAHHREDHGPLTARALSQSTDIPLPTVTKLLKSLCKAELLASQRGVQGGYRLLRPAKQITVLEVITAIDGPVELTDCAGDTPKRCDIEARCPSRSNWRRINDAVRVSLESLTIADMAPPRHVQASTATQLVTLGHRERLAGAKDS